MTNVSEHKNFPKNETEKIILKTRRHDEDK